MHPLKTKENQEFSEKIRNFILCFDKPKIFFKEIMGLNSKVMKSEHILKIIT